MGRCTVSRMDAQVGSPLGAVDAESLSAPDLVATLAERFGARLVLACSFQKEETVLLDMLFAAAPDASVFALDTHVLFPETYEYWHLVEKRYGTRVEVFEGPSLGRQAVEHGPALWESAPDRCCAIRKVEPLGRALADRDCWITGVRRDQSPTRVDTPKLGWDGAHGLWKASPLADWDDDRTWAYIRERDLPYNALHDRGYASIGCTYCTMPGQGRAGRWASSDKTECGLHAPATG
jgi:phosphoadenosine phosphosulfate reductase